LKIETVINAATFLPNYTPSHRAVYFYIFTRSVHDDEEEEEEEKKRKKKNIGITGACDKKEPNRSV
jgi:hypothetical protein